MHDQNYIIALKRETMSIANADWQDIIRDIHGVTILNGNKKRLKINATEEGIAILQNRLGNLCHIEPIIIHHVH